MSVFVSVCPSVCLYGDVHMCVGRCQFIDGTHAHDIYIDEYHEHAEVMPLSN